MRVAVVTVGDELLSGDTANTNATWLCRRLTERGVDVERVLTVPDDVGDIAQVVNESLAAYDAVVVTGGLGPTHDDLTMEGVAAAVGREVESSAEAEAWLTEQGGYAASDLAPGTTHLPAGARVLHNEAGVAPGCVVESVYVLPGVPEEMEAMFEQVAPEFSGTIRHVEVVDADEPESALVERVAELRERFDVRVGSYPGETVSVKLSGVDEDEVRAAATWLRERVDEPGT
ncbi:competence/damage-inducible protein A [Haloarchaeobius salinus]|uniref:competence/damage-inducible protein A n=1 Tax=Haloarchaeobius salinus TaxID=1198298 RepID=UPI0021097CD5|nr:molybdopterin-binding protein [Haloarchaeobius salinus]